MTRDEARASWLDGGKTYLDLNLGTVQRLRNMIGKEMKASGLISGSYRMQAKIKISLQCDGFCCELFCRSHYFKDREAVTFNGNGFIGFAGWADEKNVQPILSAFVHWCQTENNQ